jgi:hypothetical protein
MSPMSPNFQMSPDEAQQYTQMAFGRPPQPPQAMARVNPHDTLTVPLGPPAPEPTLMAPGGSAPKEAPSKMSLQPEEENLNNRLMADYKKDSDPYGSPDNHPGFFGKFLHGLNVATGGVNRRAFEEQGLEKRAEGLSKLESDENLQGATAGKEVADTGKTNAETPEVAPNAESNRNLQGAEARHLNDEADNLENPQPSFEVHDTDAGPLLINKKDGTAQHLTVDGAPVGEKVKLSYQTVDGPDGQPHTYGMDEKGNKVVDLGKHYERPISVTAGENKNLWSVPQPDGSKKVISLKPGDTIPQGAVSLSGQSSENLKSGTNDKPTQDALTFANDYLQSGAFTGPSDEALQDQFFQMAKPSSGFRMNQAQIDQLHHMASWMDSWRAKLYHATTGTWFAPEQRQQIVKTMNDLARSKGIGTATGGAGQGGGGQNTSGPPAGATQVGHDAKGNVVGWVVNGAWVNAGGAK